LNPEKFAFAVGVAVFAAGSLDLILHRVLPEKHVTGGGKDMIGAVVGLLTLLSALVLGLLIWTAYGVYAGQNVAIQTLAAKVLQLDLALADYGPEAKDAVTLPVMRRPVAALPTGKVIGKHETPYPNLAGILATPDLVFSGEPSGQVYALDAKTL
jgi:hypothetical protein